MAEKKVAKKAPAKKTTKAPVAKKTVKKPSAKQSTSKLAMPKNMRVQTAEGWNRARLKEQESK